MHFDNKKQKLFRENVLKGIENSAIEIFDPGNLRSKSLNCLKDTEIHGKG